MNRLKSLLGRSPQTCSSGDSGRVGSWITLALTLALIIWCMAWEGILAPLRPGGTWLILKGLPLLCFVPGLLRGRLRSLQGLSLTILLYGLEGFTRAFSDAASNRWAAWIEILLSTAVWMACLVSVRQWRRRQKS